MVRILYRLELLGIGDKEEEKEEQGFYFECDLLGVLPFGITDLLEEPPYEGSGVSLFLWCFNFFGCLCFNSFGCFLASSSPSLNFCLWCLGSGNVLAGQVGCEQRGWLSE
ncbi:hypothetical protein Dimus_004072 [Dionaea muscipula]